MLEFIDRPKAIRVIKVEYCNGKKGQRTSLGTIPKATLELDQELRSKLSNDEASEVGALLESFKEAQDARRKALIYGFPEVTREAIEYCVSGDASDLERRLLKTALNEAVRTLQKNGEL